MKTKLLTKINVLLGVLAAFFAGCHCQSHVQRNRGPEAKYGVPQEILDQWERERQQAQDSVSQPQEAQPAAEVADEAESVRPVAQPKKYGPMPPRD